jgi:hypothetical protein
MRSTKNIKLVTVLLLIIVILTGVIYAIDKWKKKSLKNNRDKRYHRAYSAPLPQANATPDPNILPFIKAMPTVAAVLTDTNITVATFPDLDRQRLEREPTTLLPANEETKFSYKEWPSVNSVDNELYSNVAPLFNQACSPLVPLDVNGAVRRVNFY